MLEKTKWIIKNPDKAIHEIYSMVDRHANHKSFRNLLMENNKHICYLDFSSFCNQFNIKIIKPKIKVRFDDGEVYRRLMMFDFEMDVLCNLAKGSGVVFEIGTNRGYSITNMAYNMSVNSICHTLDWVDRDEWDAEIGHFFKNDIKMNKRIIQHYGDSTKFDFSPFYETVDLFFIDGGTSHNIISSDSHNAFRCVKKGGFIVWHDFYGLSLDYYGLTKAIIDFVEEYGMKLYFINGTRLVIANKT